MTTNAPEMTPEEAHHRLMGMAMASHREAAVLDEAQIEKLLGYGPDVNQVAPHGGIVLHVAAFYGHEELCRILLEHGADARKVDDGNGQTPLHEATYGGNVQICQMLLDAGADAKAVDGDGDTPLFGAAAVGSVEICKMLLFAGCPLERENKAGNTAISNAILYQRNNTLHELLKHGARLMEKNCEQRLEVRNMYDIICENVSEWRKRGEDVQELDGKMITYAANLGQLDDVMTPARWRGHEAHLVDTLSQLPDYFAQRILHDYPPLTQMIALPDALVQAAGAQVDAPHAQALMR